MERDSLIDLDKIISDSNSKILKKTPQFIINYFKKLVHQDELNSFINNNNDKYGIDFIKSAMQELNSDVTPIWLDDKIESERCILVCNHPLGGADFMAAVIAISSKFKNYKVLANEIVMNMVNLKDLFLPVNVFGRSPQHYYDMIDEAYASDITIFSFPAGEVSRKKKGIIKDSAWHKSFVRQAIKYKRDVIPIYVHATNSKRFYRLGGLRKKLCIKLNLEMMLLPDELFKQSNVNIPVVIGKAIPYSVFDKSQDHYNWAQYVKNKVYDLEKYV